MDRKTDPSWRIHVNQHSEFNLKDIFLYLFILGIFNVKIFVRFFLHWKGLIEEIVGNKDFHCKCLGYENHTYTKYYNKILAVTEEDNWITNKVSECTQGQGQPWEGQTPVVPSYSPL